MEVDSCLLSHFRNHWDLVLSKLLEESFSCFSISERGLHHHLSRERKLLVSDAHSWISQHRERGRLFGSWIHQKALCLLSHLDPNHRKLLLLGQQGQHAWTFRSLEVESSLWCLILGRADLTALLFSHQMGRSLHLDHSVLQLTCERNFASGFQP